MGIYIIIKIQIIRKIINLYKMTLKRMKYCYSKKLFQKIYFTIIICKI